MSDRLEGVKPGDKLKVMRQWGCQYQEYTVARVTNTQAACECGTSFKIDDGLMIGTGSRMRRSYATFLTKDDIENAKLDLRIKHARHELGRFRVTSNNIAAVESLLASKKD